MPRGVPNVVPNTRRVESENIPITQGETRVQHSDKPFEAASPIHIEDRPLEAMDQEKLAMLKFFDEMVTVRIAMTSDREADQVFEVNVNGNLEFFRRGQVKTVRRYIVDKLARLKETHYEQQEVVDKDGVKSIANIPMTALKYPFSVEQDANPRGRDWITAVLAEPA